MASILDIFNNNAFRSIELTDSINVVPNSYGRLGQMGLFTDQGVRSRTVAIQIANGVLNLLPSRPIGGPPSLGTMGPREMRNVTIPHFPHNDAVYAEDVQGVLGSIAMSGGDGLASVGDLVNDKLATMRGKHDLTVEFMKWGCLNGEVLDADGSTLVDIFATFGITQTTINMLLTNTATEVNTLVLSIKRHMETNARGTLISGVHVFCSTGFFETLMVHPMVKEILTQQRGAGMLGNDYRTGFNISGVTFEEHIGSATDADGNVRQFIPANEAIAVPLGTDLFRTYFAPADFIEAVNRPGMPVYAKQERLKFDRGIEIHTQSNPLPICKRPALLVRLTRS